MIQVSKQTNVSVQIRGVLDGYQLGPACLAENQVEVRVFLENEPRDNLSIHLATSQVEKVTGKIAQIQTISSLGPAERTRLGQVAATI